VSNPVFEVAIDRLPSPKLREWVKEVGDFVHIGKDRNGLSGLNITSCKIESAYWERVPWQELPTLVTYRQSKPVPKELEKEVVALMGGNDHAELYIHD
jgi:hypothetical protein